MTGELPVKRIILVILLFLSIGLVIWGGISIITHFIGVRSQQSFDQLIESVDELIERQSFRDADTRLRSLLSRMSTSYQALQVIKRSRELAERTLDTDIFHTSLKTAQDKFPGNEEIAVIGTLTAISRGAADRASESSRVISSGKYLSARVYASLFSRIPELKSGTELAPENILLEAAETRDPVILERAGDLTHDSRFYLDAALLLAENGQLEEAAKLINLRLADTGGEALALLLYDGGAASAADVLKGLDPVSRKRWDLVLTLADLHMRSGNTVSAETLYLRTVNTAPRFSWIPYANLAAILKFRGDVKTAVYYLEKGRQLFPDNKEIVLKLSGAYLASGDERAARTILSDLEDRFEDDPDILVFKARNGFIPRGPRFAAMLWAGVNSNPGHEELVSYLVWYLIGMGDFEGAETAIAGYRRSRGDEYWVQFYEGVLDILQERFNEAALRFGSLAGLDGTPATTWAAEAYFNLGLILSAEMQYQTAGQRFAIAAEMSGKLGDRDLELRSLNAYARTLLYSRKWDDCRKVLNTVLEKDPSSLEAHVTEKDLERLTRKN